MSPSHHATNKDVRNWSLGAIAAGILSTATIVTYASGLWGTAVQAGLPKDGDAVLVTQKQLTAVTNRVDALDAGAAKKEDVRRIEVQMQRVEGKLDRLIEIQLKKGK